MKRIWFAALAMSLLTAGTLPAQDIPAPPTVDGPPRPATVAAPLARITGTVTCADTRRPARGAMVMVMPLPSADPKVRNFNSQPISTRVAMDGTFVAEHLAPGEYTVIAVLPGYLSAFDSLMSGEFEVNGPGPSVERERALLASNGTTVLHAAETATRDVVLTRGAAVSGRVLYSDGSPATQIAIVTEDVNRKPPASAADRDLASQVDLFRAMLTHQSTGTDDQGHFRIAGLPPGSYRVAAAQIGGGSNGEQALDMSIAGFADTASMRFYSGDTNRRSGAKVYELRAGDEVADISITIPDTLLHQVRGSISAIGGKAVTSASITLKDSAEDGLSFSIGITGADTFAFPQVPAGTYTLSVTDAKYQDFTPVLGRGRGESQALQEPTLFAAETRNLVVKDADITDANFTLKEAPPSAAPKTPATPAPPPL